MGKYTVNKITVCIICETALHKVFYLIILGHRIPSSGFPETKQMTAYMATFAHTHTHTHTN